MLPTTTTYATGDVWFPFIAVENPIVCYKSIIRGCLVRAQPRLDNSVSLHTISKTRHKATMERHFSALKDSLIIFGVRITFHSLSPPSSLV